jgi:tetratricopeptide (TPR) repeat protein
MKEFTLYDKIAIVRSDLLNKPYSINLNLLLFSYLTLLKLYDELLDKTMLFTMSVFTPCALAEDFRALACIANGNINDAKIEIRYVNSIDLEDPYSYLLNGLIKFATGEDPKEDFAQALTFLNQSEREEMEKFLNMETNRENLELYAPPDIITDDIVNKIDIAIENTPNYLPLKVSFAEILMKKENLELAKEKLMAILSQYPFYPRAIALLAKIYNKMGKAKEAKFTIRNLLAINPLTVYVNGLEEFIEEKEPAEAKELKLLFETNNPIIAFFKEMHKKIEGGEFKPNPKVEEAVPQKETSEEKYANETELKESKEEQIKEPEKAEATAEVTAIKKEEIAHEKPEKESEQKEAVWEKLKEESLEGGAKESPLAAENRNPPNEKTALDMGFEFLHKKEYEKAIKEFLQALKEGL